MSALYTMRYVGPIGLKAGAGALYVGRNVLVGVDIGGNRYHGSYVEESGRLRGAVTLTATENGAELVTGLTLGRGQTLAISVDLPLDLADGNAHQIRVAGNPVSVVFEKIGDIP